MDTVEIMVTTLTNARLYNTVEDVASYVIFVQINGDVPLLMIL